LVAFKRFMANEWDRVQAGKRGGGCVHVSLDTATAESRYQDECTDELTADKIYERRWALTLLDQTLARLKQEFTASGRAEEFEQLKTFLSKEPGSVSYAGLAPAMGMSEGALRVAVHRLRRRFREVFREEISHTVADAADIDEEVRYLLKALVD
jgi:RNA polymerase sigma-70 factor (ECF subfamily)